MPSDRSHSFNSGYLRPACEYLRRQTTGRTGAVGTYVYSLSPRLDTPRAAKKGGIGLRGPGEKQLETDRRLLAGRIKQIRSRLDAVRSRRALSRRARKRAELPVVSLVGYTNAGKSTLFNADRRWSHGAGFALCDVGPDCAPLGPTRRRAGGSRGYGRVCS